MSILFNNVHSAQDPERRSAEGPALFLIAMATMQKNVKQAGTNESIAPAAIQWPCDVLERIVLFLVFDGAAVTWNQLAFLTHRNEDLKDRTLSMPRPLVFNISFDYPAQSRTFLVPFQKATTVHIEIDWGDGGGIEVFMDPGKGFAAHDYAGEATEYRVRVFPHGDAATLTESAGSTEWTGPCWLDHLGVEVMSYHPAWVLPLVSISTWGSLGIRSFSSLLSCVGRNVSLPAEGIPNTVQDLSFIFSRDNDFNPPIGHWDVSNVTNMESMFAGCSSFDPPIGSWNVGNVRNMSKMFAECAKFNHPIQAWNVENVLDMSEMFHSAISFNQPIGSWNVSKVNNMGAMFARARNFNQPLGNWNVSSVTDMAEMFAACPSITR